MSFFKECKIDFYVKSINSVLYDIRNPEKHVKEKFQRRHDRWNQSIIFHPVSHILLATVHRRDKARVCREGYLAMCAPFATLYQKIKAKK